MTSSIDTIYLQVGTIVVFVKGGVTTRVVLADETEVKMAGAGYGSVSVVAWADADDGVATAFEPAASNGFLA